VKEEKYPDVDEDDFSWIPCIVCGGELNQEAEARFRCVNCKQEYIACAEDMKK